MTTYAQKLRDPRWQARRVEILNLHGWECEECDACQKLHIHHRIYHKHREPWDYPDEELACLCENCHKAEHALRRTLDELMADRDASLDTIQLIGYAEGLKLLSAPGVVCCQSYEWAQGFGDALGASADAIIAYLNTNSHDHFNDADARRILASGSKGKPWMSKWL